MQKADERARHATKENLPDDVRENERARWRRGRVLNWPWRPRPGRTTAQAWKGQFNRLALLIIQAKPWSHHECNALRLILLSVLGSCQPWLPGCYFAATVDCCTFHIFLGCSFFVVNQLIFLRYINIALFCFCCKNLHTGSEPWSLYCPKFELNLMVPVHIRCCS